MAFGTVPFNARERFTAGRMFFILPTYTKMKNGAGTMIIIVPAPFVA
jgi:hypothetical protein